MERAGTVKAGMDGKLFVQPHHLKTVVQTIVLGTGGWRGKFLKHISTSNSTTLNILSWCILRSKRTNIAWRIFADAHAAYNAAIRSGIKAWDCWTYDLFATEESRL
jgi:hypothetical protein